jgi:hypothetical protein
MNGWIFYECTGGCQLADNLYTPGMISKNAITAATKFSQSQQENRQLHHQG